MTSIKLSTKAIDFDLLQHTCTYSPPHALQEKLSTQVHMLALTLLRDGIISSATFYDIIGIPNPNPNEYPHDVQT